jgi:adenylate kinase
MAGRTRGPILTILGRQGAGKGTQATRMAERFGLVHLSTGDLLREAVADGTPLGERVARDLDAGRLVADDVMRDVVAARLERPEVHRSGVVLDGYPRTPEQVGDLEAVLAPDSLDAAILLDVPLPEVRRRIEVRRVCPECGTTVVAEHDEDEVACPLGDGVAVRRQDDTPEAIDRRLATYEAEAQPLLDALDDVGILVRVDALGTPDEVWARLLHALLPIVGGDGRAAR